VEWGPFWQFDPNSVDPRIANWWQINPNNQVQIPLPGVNFPATGVAGDPDNPQWNHRHFFDARNRESRDQGRASGYPRYGTCWFRDYPYVPPPFVSRHPQMPVPGPRYPQPVLGHPQLPPYPRFETDFRGIQGGLHFHQHSWDGDGAF
jgi:hypothetical protein